MTVRYGTTPEKQTLYPTSTGGQFTAWLLGIVGAIAVFLGLFILFGGEDQYLGLGGDWSWRVGDISSAWAYGLLIGGAIFLLITLALVVRHMTTPQARARKRVNALSDLIWHTAIFALVNAFLWIQDIVAGGGLEYAYWTTIPWAIGLAAHAIAYFVGERRLEERKFQEHLEAERRELQPH